MRSLFWSRYPPAAGRGPGCDPRRRGAAAGVGRRAPGAPRTPGAPRARASGTRRGVSVALGLALGLALAGCGDPAPPESPPDAANGQSSMSGQSAGGRPGPPGDAPIPVLSPSEPFGLDWLSLRSPDGDEQTFHVYVATDAEQQSRGLMHREELPELGGMVFLFDRPRTGGFWMKNTLIPLSIAFFDRDGEILVVLDMEPCEADPCPVYDPEVTYQGALEVNQGAFDERGIVPGWTVLLPEGA